MSVEHLIAWVKAREELRKKKESGAPPPWTSDEILQTYRFCNVRRRDDRVSRWLRQHVLTGANLNYSFSQFIMFAAFCRWCNWPPTIAEIIKRGLYPSPGINWEGIAALMDELRTNKQKIWTGAFMVTARGVVPGQSKAHFIARKVIYEGISLVLPQLEKALVTNSRREVWSVFKSIPSWGSFMAGQVTDDLAWTVLLSSAKDTNTWAPVGPGSLRGFNRVLELPLRTRHPEEEWCSNLQAWRKQAILSLGKEYKDVDLMSWQNINCEFDKYERTRLGEGRPRSKYRSETAY